MGQVVDWVKPKYLPITFCVSMDVWVMSCLVLFCIKFTKDSILTALSCD